MHQYKGYLIDLDGTIYRGEERIEYAKEFVEKLVDKNIPYLFVTNNSAKTREDVARKLTNMNIPATSEHIFTTSMATARYIKQKKEQANCYVIGENGLNVALKEENMTFTTENCDFVIVGIDREINYEKLSKACLAIRNGAEFISTNADVSIPTERGFLPGNGALTSVISVSTGVQPTFIGKPASIIMEEAIMALGMERRDILLVGDNYDTDILAGINIDMDTLHVGTGVTTFEDMKKKEKGSTYQVHTLNEWTGNI